MRNLAQKLWQKYTKIYFSISIDTVRYIHDYSSIFSIDFFFFRFVLCLLWSHTNGRTTFSCCIHFSSLPSYQAVRLWLHSTNNKICLVNVKPITFDLLYTRSIQQQTRKNEKFTIVFSVSTVFLLLFFHTHSLSLCPSLLSFFFFVK